MKIKTLALVLILFGAASVTQIHAFGFGAQFNASAGRVFSPGAALLVSPSDTTHMAVNWYFADGVNSIGFTLDVIPLTLPITTFSAGSLNFTLGAGLFASMVFAGDFGFDGGLRVPVGLNFMLGNIFEIFAHVAPSFGMHLIPSMEMTDFFFPFAIGARLWVH